MLIDNGFERSENISHLVREKYEGRLWRETRLDVIIIASRACITEYRCSSHILINGFMVNEIPEEVSSQVSDLPQRDNDFQLLVFPALSANRISYVDLTTGKNAKTRLKED